MPTLHVVARRVERAGAGRVERQDARRAARAGTDSVVSDSTGIFVPFASNE